MPDTRNILVADGFTEVWVAHGLARITLAQTGPDGKAVTAGQLCVPVSQVAPLARAMATLVEKIEAEMKTAPQGAVGPMR